MRRASRLAALGAVLGPGLLAGLADDDPAGITTYSILGADYGYQLLWVLVLATLALVLFHELGAPMGIATGQGLIGLVRERYGVRWGGLALIALVVANAGTMCAEFAGVAARSTWPGSPAMSASRSQRRACRCSCCAEGSSASNTCCSPSAPCSPATSSPACSPIPTGAPQPAASWCRACR